MRLNLYINIASLRRWHLDLIARLDGIAGLDLAVVRADRDAEDRAGLRGLFGMEKFLHGLTSAGPYAQARIADMRARPVAVPPDADLAIDLTGHAQAAGKCWTLRIDGRPGEDALIESLLAGRVPLAELAEGSTVIAAGRLGTEYGGIVLAKLGDVLSRLVTLIEVAVKGGRPHVPALPVAGAPASRTEAASVAVVMAKELAMTCVDRVYRRLFHAPHWRVGWRKLDGPDLFDLGQHPEAGWHDLPDDGERFYADPFPILHRGRVTLFVEEYPHATGKGIISAVEFGSEGPLGSPRPVLEQPGHLSYPFVFERDGDIWMIPESCSAGRVDLFRATAFPGGWVREATLIDGVVASDATLMEHGGLWWLFATVRDGGGAFSDALHLWSAPDFRGPWTAHPHNPVLIDIASARPAGAMVVRNGALLRPVQDCRFGYGRALAIARVTRLDQQGFDQEVETIIGAGPRWPGRRQHTLNSAGGFEFTDGSGMARRPLLPAQASLALRAKF